ncbi:histidine phosphatase family protein [Nocardioides campestrisoli]|uniref:histidine phosphatase family protein n=1 Tax=Nocardioides campestrisoli TaxID=2736757 RepID=UPI0015E6D061|nr:histidine phosphatase family protein [Nocardioides campestrisoli]
MRLLLLRHGQTHGNVAGALDTGVPGLDLTDLGRAQARAAARALDGTGVEGVFVSRLVRTVQTSDPLVEAAGLPRAQLPGLHEIAAGAYEMATDHDSVHGYLSTVQHWVHGELDVRMPGGESGTEFLERYDADVERVVDSGAETALVVSHGAAIRTWVASRVPDVAGRPEAVSPLHNTGLITVEGHPTRGWRLVEWHADPIGGHLLEDESAPDPTGEPVEE